MYFIVSSNTSQSLTKIPTWIHSSLNFQRNEIEHLRLVLGIFSATKAGTYIFTTHALAVVNRGYFRMKKNDDVICGAWVHGDWGDVTCSTVTHLDLGDEVKVTGDDYGPAEILCGHSGFSGILIYPD